MTWFALNARSEFVKPSRLDATGSNGGGVFAAPRPASFGGGSGGDARPAGAFGSKNPSGFGRLAIRSIFLAASPASCNPAFSPTRGSFAAGTAGTCCPAPLMMPAPHSNRIEKQRHRVAADLIADAP